jgi:hypothetical protein
MIQYVIALAISCGNPKIVNDTDKWSKYDQNALEDTKDRCKIHFKDAPCLKIFIKKEENVYRAICGS